MNNLERFEHLARRASEDRPPSIDIARQVMQRVAIENRATVATTRVLAACCAVSTVAALIMVAVTVWSWTSWTDPLGQMFAQTLTVVQ